MLAETSHIRRLLLFLQVILFFFIERILPPSLKFFSSYGTISDLNYHPLWTIPAALLIATFFKERFRPVFFMAFTLVLLKSLILSAVLLIFFILFFYGVRKNVKNNQLTFFWLILLGVLTFSSIYYLNGTGTLSWFWLLLHVSWALKLIAWTVTVRVYDVSYSFKECVEFFFNPVFFFFTNDLNVLTPRKFFSAKSNSAHFDKMAFRRTGIQSLIGLCLLVLYGVTQKYYFMNLENLGFLGLPFIGSIVSIFTAILFHSANSFIQVSMLNAFSYDLEVDMNRPWLSISPADYWKRMHFYVRDYIFEIITKPVLTNVMRWNTRLINFRVFIIGLVYLIFTCTQIGYQPYRQGRTLLVGFLVTGVFVAMMALPELILTKRTQQYLEKNHWLGRAMTFIILYVGYYFIFASRKGF